MFRRFLEDERGFAFIFFLMSMPAFVGIALIVIDIGRVNNLHYDLQKSVDSLALAGAAELDGSPTSITRANAAITGLLVNRSRFSDNGDVTVNAANVTWRFLKSIPADDDTPIDNSHNFTDWTDAIFVEVTANPQPYSTIFPVGNASQTLNVGAQAVAGFTSGVCDFMPMFICNPYENEPGGIKLEDVLNDPALQRKQIELRQQGGGSSQAFAGNFGFLESPTSTNQGADGLREMFATIKPPACFDGRGVLIKPGFKATVTDALNVRFDIYDGPMNSNKNDSNYRPAENVRKGYEQTGGNECNSDPSVVATDFMPLPRDNNFTDMQGGAIGDGFWDFDSYWAVNFDHSTGGHTPIAVPNGWSNVDPPSRYDVYRYEVDNGLMSSTSVGGEDGAPGCYTGGTLNDDPDRRIIYGAILDCEALEAEGKISGSHQEPLPVRAFGSFFVTEALEKGLGSLPGEHDNQTFRVELVDLTGPDGDGSLDDFQRNEAVIYR